MITRQKFENYKIFREQAGCPLCRRPDVPYGDGLYWCALDEKFNPLEETVRKSLESKIPLNQITQRHIHNALLNSTPSYYAYHCMTCRAYWIETIDGKRILDVPNEFDSEPQNSAGEIERVTPQDAIRLLAKNAYSFLEEGVRASVEFNKLIEEYACFRAKVDVIFLNGLEQDRSLEKPLVICREELAECLFELIKQSLLKKYPNRGYHQSQAEKLYSNKEYAENLNRLFLGKMMSGFLIDIFHKAKLAYSNLLRTRHPREARFILDDNENADKFLNFLYGKCVELIVDCMSPLGIEITLVDREKIIYGNVIISEKDSAINIFKTVVLRDVNIYILPEEQTMGKINFGKDATIKGDFTTNMSTEALQKLPDKLIDVNATIEGGVITNIGDVLKNDNDDFYNAIIETLSNFVKSHEAEMDMTGRNREELSKILEEAKQNDKTGRKKLRVFLSDTANLTTIAAPLASFLAANGDKISQVVKNVFDSIVAMVK